MSSGNDQEELELLRAFWKTYQKSHSAGKDRKIGPKTLRNYMEKRRKAAKAVSEFYACRIDSSTSTS